MKQKEIIIKPGNIIYFKEINNNSLFKFKFTKDNSKEFKLLSNYFNIGSRQFEIFKIE